MVKRIGLFLLSLLLVLTLIPSNIILNDVSASVIYSVIYDGNGATSGSMSRQGLVNGEGKLNKNRFVKTNSSFLGWSRSKNATKATYMDGEYVKFSTDITLYAVWSGNSNVTITFHPNGASGNRYSQLMPENTLTSLDANKFVRKGYSFQGWSSKPDGNVIYSDTQKARFSSNVTLYAIWKKGGQDVTITYNANGATSGSMFTQILKSGEGKLNKNKFVRSGYVFSGWSTNRNSTKGIYSDGEYVTFGSNVTLYAIWTKNSSSVDPSGPSKKSTFVSITYNANGGTGNNYSQSTLQGRDTILMENKFTRKGYNFAGWATSKNGKVIYKNKCHVNFSKNMTLYAKWEPESYTVIFDANGGTGKMASQKIQVGKSVALNGNKFKRNGYIFVGWAVKSDMAKLPSGYKRDGVKSDFKKSSAKKAYVNNNGWYKNINMKHFQLGKVTYKDKKKVKNLASNNKTIRLYAVWKGNGPQAALDWGHIIANEDLIWYGSWDSSGSSCMICHPSKANHYVCHVFALACYTHGTNNRGSCHIKGLDHKGKTWTVRNSKLSHGKYKYIGKPSFSKLQPGDIIIREHHTWIYAGGDMRLEATASKGAHNDARRKKQLAWKSGAKKSYGDKRVYGVVRYIP